MTAVSPLLSAVRATPSVSQLANRVRQILVASPGKIQQQGFASAELARDVAGAGDGVRRLEGGKDSFCAAGQLESLQSLVVGRGAHLEPIAIPKVGELGTHS